MIQTDLHKLRLQFEENVPFASIVRGNKTNAALRLKRRTLFREQRTKIHRTPKKIDDWCIKYRILLERIKMRNLTTC